MRKIGIKSKKSKETRERRAILGENGGKLLFLWKCEFKIKSSTEAGKQE